MKHARVFKSLLVSAAMGAPLTCATGAGAAEPDDRRWGVGTEATLLGRPQGHLGVAANRGAAVTPMIVGRYQVLKFAAIDGGFGLPHPGLGVGGWLSWEVFAPVVANEHKTLLFSLFEQSGAQLGYAGPDYFARHGGDFVGYQYAVAGPLAFALRFPIGANLRWAGGYLDSYVAAVPIVTLTPAAEIFYDVTLGTRVRF